MSAFVEVAIPVAVRKTFSYSVPPELRNRIAVGMRVLVPFGRRLMTGYVVSMPAIVSTAGFNLRPVRDLIDGEALAPPSLVETALWTAQYYFAPPGEVLRALFPVGSQVKGEKKIFLADKTAALLCGGLRPSGLSPQENVLIDLLDKDRPLTLEELTERSGMRNVRRWIESLAAGGWVRVEDFADAPRSGSKEQLMISRSEGSVDATVKLPPAQRRLYEALSDPPQTLMLQEVLRHTGCSSGVARALEKKGLVKIFTANVQRVPVELAESRNMPVPTLTASQKEVFEKILDMIRQEKAGRCLLHGVTGSGKTEIYLRLIGEILNRGWTAMFLVPEIGLTPLLSRQVVSRFPNRVSLMHSGMSAGERFDQWNRIRSGEARVVVGTRSAVFAPLNDLKLIVIDEEQDASYKQQESPCYHAREVAWHRVQQTKGVLVLGSATPCVETFYAARQSGEAVYLNLPERIEARPLPRVTLVDMSAEFRKCGKATVISTTLREELEGCMRRGEQAMVLLNRRGFARTLLCRGCGHVYACPDCSVSMTYHRQENRLTCHYCGREQEVPSACAGCGGPYIHYAGVGTEQLESILKELMPGARIARLDRDTTRKRGALRSVLFAFADRRLDILVGTQILAKGHDFPDVTLVGVVAADAGLSFPDFRSAERTFQLLTQVAGRAGRGTAPGRVVIQSFHPDHYALQFAQKQDYSGFFEKEIEYRKWMGYPPFRKLIQIVVTDRDDARALRNANRIASILKTHFEKIQSPSRPHVLGPASAPLEKLRGLYRMQILIKAHPAEDIMPFLQESFSDVSGARIASKVRVDVDPISLL